MPLFDFDCPFDGRFELLLREAPKGRRACPMCRTRSPLVAPLVVMRPDTAWSGVMDKNVGYIVSDSQRKRLLKERNLVEIGNRDDREAMKREADRAAKDRKSKEATERRQALEEAISGSGLVDSFGQLRPEATEKLTDERILE